jgi:cytochrome P450
VSDAALARLDIFDRRRPAAPVPEANALRGLRFLKKVRGNPLFVLPAAAYRFPTFVVRTIIGDFCTVSDPVAIKHVLLDNVENYPKGRQQQIRLKPGLGNGLLTAEGASWRFQRRTASPVFQHRKLAGFSPAMAAATEEMLARWEEAGEGAELDIANEMMRLTYDIISRTVFSNEVDLPHETMSNAISVYLDTVGRGDLASLLGLPAWVPSPARLRVAPHQRIFRGEVKRITEARRARMTSDPSSIPDDLLTRLLTARDPDTGAALSDEEVYDNASTFIAAGHETTANALAWTLYLLSEFPWADARLLAEVSKVADPAADFEALPYCRMVLEESMRLYPPAPFMARQAIAADTLGGHALRPGAQVMISPWLLHRHHTLWDEPDLFMPERFAPGRKEKIHRFAYMPFGGGQRICIGMGFAMQEAMIILAKIVRRWRLELKPGHPVEPLARITLRPRYGLKMNLVRR